MWAHQAVSSERLSLDGQKKIANCEEYGRLGQDVETQGFLVQRNTSQRPGESKRMKPERSKSWKMKTDVTNTENLRKQQHE